jgi:hypothetical protein
VVEARQLACRFHDRPDRWTVEIRRLEKEKFKSLNVATTLSGATY